MYVGVQYQRMDVTGGQLPDVGQCALVNVDSTIGSFDSCGIMDSNHGGHGTSYKGISVSFNGTKGYIYGTPTESGTYYVAFGVANVGFYEIEVEVFQSSYRYGTVHYTHSFTNGNDYTTYSFVKNCVTTIPYLLWQDALWINNGDTVDTPSLEYNSKYYRFDFFHYKGEDYNDWNRGFYIVNVENDQYINTELTIWKFYVEIQRRTASGSLTTASNTAYDSGTVVTFDATQSKGAVMTHYDYASTWLMGWQYHGSNDISDTVSALSFTLNVGNVVFTPNVTGKQYTVSFSANGGVAVGSGLNPQTIRYPTKITLPTSNDVTKQYYALAGWTDGTTTYQDGGQYQPTGNITLSAVWQGTEYTVTYVGPDGTTLGSKSVDYPQTVALGDDITKPTYSEYTFKTWRIDGVDYADGYTYQPNANVTCYAIYEYTRTLQSDNWTPVTVTKEYPQTIDMTQYSPTPQSGKYLVGWKLNGTSNVFNTYIPNLSDASDIIDAVWTESPLTAMTIKNADGTAIANNEITLTYANTQSGHLTVDLKIDTTPSDWVGTSVDWVCDVPSAIGTFFKITQTSSTAGNLRYKIQLLASSDTVYHLYTKSGNIVSKVGNENQIISLTLNESYPVRFYLDNSFKTDSTVEPWRTAVVFKTGDEYSWGSDAEGYPSDPPAQSGSAFAYWTDADGNLVDYFNIPRYEVDCVAYWVSTFVEEETNRLVIQRFNSDGTAIVMQVVIDVATSFSDSFTPSLSTFETPTQPSSATFITDMSVMEARSFGFVRATPKSVDNESPDMSKWDNEHWFLALRSLVDRWQSDTDGIKFIFLPIGLHRIRQGVPMAGELVGTDYDFIGYENTYDEENQKWRFGANNGLRYDLDGETILLVGENGIITDYEDTLDAKYTDSVNGSISIQVGGYTSNYIKIKGDDE